MPTKASDKSRLKADKAKDDYIRSEMKKDMDYAREMDRRKIPIRKLPEVSKKKKKARRP
jgi:hypothetical protein